MTTTYEVLDPNTACARGAYEPMVSELRAGSSWDWDSDGVFRCEDGRPVELIGMDGGEPEDQTLRRDWRWIAPALQAAFELGQASGGRP